MSITTTAELSAEKKRALLARLLSNKARRTRTFPLSFAQERLWFLNQLVPGSHLYNLPKAVRITGPLKVSALEQSLNEIRRRHEILRTTYSISEGWAAQSISPAKYISLPVCDLENWPEANREWGAEELGREESQRPFDLTNGPVLRATLIRLNDSDHIILITLHHIAGDGLSLGILISELTILYQAFSRGRPSSFAELPIQYVDFAIWQRERLQGEALDRHKAYWERQFGGTLPRLNLPTDYPRPAVRTYRGNTRFFYIPSKIALGLNRLGREEGTTLFMTLLAAFQTLLYRYTGQEDIIVGSPISNRHRVETERLIGCLINTLALRTSLSGNPTFRELLARVREVSLGAYAHQDLPFDKLVQELQPGQRLGPTSLFQVWFVLDHVANYTQESVEFLGLKFYEVYAAMPSAQFDLTLSMSELGQELIGFWNFNIDLFKVETIDLIIEHFTTLLEEITTNPDRSLIDFPLATKAGDTQAASDEADQAEFLF